MATSKGQRVGILVIAVIMVIGTVGSFAVLVLANKNQSIDMAQAEQQQKELMEQYRQQIEEARKLNEPLDGYKATAFDADAVDELEVEVLHKGDGEVVSSDSTISANYFGWQADGTIFDSTKKVDQDAEPVDFSLDQVIEGWTAGLSGKTVGSTVELTIPADQAYGNTDDGYGTPTGPLKFIVEIKELK